MPMTNAISIEPVSMARVRIRSAIYDMDRQEVLGLMEQLERWLGNNSTGRAVLSASAIAVLEKCCQFFNITRLTMLVRMRNNESVETRWHTMAAIRELGLSLPEIGRVMAHVDGRERDHGTILYGLRQHENRMKTDGNYRQVHKNLVSYLKKESE